MIDQGMPPWTNYELYRWPDGWRVVRRIEADFPNDTVAIYRMTDPDGALDHEDRVISRLYLDAEGDRKVALLSQTTPKEATRWRAFMLSMLYPLPSDVQTHPERLHFETGLPAPFLTRPLSDSFQGPFAAKLERLLAPHRERIRAANPSGEYDPGRSGAPGEDTITGEDLDEVLVALEDFLNDAGLPYDPQHSKVRSRETPLPDIDAWVDLPNTTGIQIYYTPNDRMEGTVDHSWSVEAAYLDDTYIYQGDTFQKALSQLFWLIAPSELEAWLVKHTLPGTPTIDLEIYRLLNLPSPLWLDDDRFTQWIAGATSE